MNLRRKHLAAGTYFVWRCHHQNGQEDRAGDRNDGPSQADCEVELVDVAPLGHRRLVASVELAEALEEFSRAVEKASKSIVRIRGESV